VEDDRNKNKDKPANVSQSQLEEKKQRSIYGAKSKFFGVNKNFVMFSKLNEMFE